MADQGGADFGQMPPAPPMDMNGGMPPMGNDMMPPADDGENYEADMDIDVEADENTEPEKYIQQVTGKLSQSLRKYNESLPQPDADLNKYVAGMINAQALKGLSKEDADEIIKKIQDDTANPEQPQGNEGGEMPNNMQPPMQGDEGGMQPQGNEPPMMEGRLSERTITTFKKNDDISAEPKKKKSFKTSPYNSPSWNKK